jgi:hypothetical protein
MAESPVSLTSLLADHRMCLSCLAAKLGMRSETVEITLEVMERTLPIRRKLRTCPFCGMRGTVYGLEWPAPSVDRS